MIVVQIDVRPFTVVDSLRALGILSFHGTGS